LLRDCIEVLEIQEGRKVGTQIDYVMDFRDKEEIEENKKMRWRSVIQRFTDCLYFVTPVAQTPLQISDLVDN
jgi:hypothetical protein